MGLCLGDGSVDGVWDLSLDLQIAAFHLGGVMEACLDPQGSESRDEGCQKQAGSLNWLNCCISGSVYKVESDYKRCLI